MAPGRIELLGNHLDYNGGPVLAAAIDRYVVVVRGDGDASIGLIAADVIGATTESLDPTTLRDWRNPSSPPGPADYARGAIAAMLARYDVGLMAPSTLAIAGDVPIGFGLSSSAALCVAFSLALTKEAPPARNLVLIAQEAEHRAGTPCGTMDQSASVAGGVIRFDGATLGVERLAPDLAGLVFAVADSGVERHLATSAYPTRVAEGQQATLRLRALLGVALPHLAALTPEEWTSADRRGGLPDLLARRVRHVVSETQRVAAGADALAAGDWERFGALMTASGRSSATDYDISHPRVEEMVSEALEVDGVLGARMMGGGEGGTVLMLLARDAVSLVERRLRAGYYRRYGMEHRRDLIHVCAFTDGARVEPIGAA